MRHCKKTIKLGRKSEHRNLLLANQVCSLIEHSRIRTTLAKAKAVRPFAEKMITLGKRGDLELAASASGRQGGYCRVVKLGPRQSDSAPMAYLEFVDRPTEAEKPEGKPATEKKN
jgi:large subunit ribosomal protein L17